jgi:hypothetical protein
MERNIRVRMVNPTYAEVQQKLTILVIEVTKREREEQQAKQCKRSLAKPVVVFIFSSLRFCAKIFFSLPKISWRTFRRMRKRNR